MRQRLALVVLAGLTATGLAAAGLIAAAALLAALLIILVLLALLALLALLLAGLLARLRLILALLLIVLTRLAARLVVLVVHSVRPPKDGLSQPCMNPRASAIVPAKHRSSQGFFVQFPTLAQGRGLRSFAAAGSRTGLIRQELAHRIGAN
jgi:hypothetical protein